MPKLQDILATAKQFAKKATKAIERQEYKEALKWFVKAIKQSEKAIRASNRELDYAYAELGYTAETMTQKQRMLFQFWRSEALKLAKKHKLESEQEDIYEIGNNYDPFYWDKEAKASIRSGNLERVNTILAWWSRGGNYYSVAETHKKLKNLDKAIEYYEKCSNAHMEAIKTGSGGGVSAGHDALKKAIMLAKSANIESADRLYHKLINFLVSCGDSQMKQSDLVYGDEGIYFYNQAQALYEEAARLAERMGSIDEAIMIYRDKTRVGKRKIERLEKKKNNTAELSKWGMSPRNNSVSPWRCLRCGHIIMIKDKFCSQCGCVRFKYQKYG